MRLRAVLLALLALFLTAAPAAAATPSWRPPPPMASAGKTVEVSAVRVFGLPAALGEHQIFDSVGDDDEKIATAIWERRRGDGWEVEASFTVVRAPWLTDPATAFAWLKRWQERPALEAVYREIALPDRTPAWLADDQVIWQPEPGSIASVTLHEHHASPSRLMAIAASAMVDSRSGRTATRP